MLAKQPIVKIQQLSKSFGRSKALKEVTFEIYPGEVVGFIGPNGAGKSTTIRIMLGLLKKTAGEIQLFGLDPFKDSLSIHQRISYVPGDLALWENLSGGETIDLLMQLHGKANQVKKQQLIERFQLDVTKKIKNYSKGNRQKVGLIAALAVESDLYILDEPTSGLDPLMEVIFQEEVAQLKQLGKAILLSSHILSEVERLADRVVIIQSGTIVESGTLASLRHLSQSTVHVQTKESLAGLKEWPFIQQLTMHNNHQATFAIASERLNELLAKLSEFQLIHFEVLPATLEEVFMQHYQEPLKNQADKQIVK